MIKPLILDLALPLYTELPSSEAKASDIEVGLDSSVGSDAYGAGLESSLQLDLPSSEETRTLFVYG